MQPPVSHLPPSSPPPESGLRAEAQIDTDCESYTAPDKQGGASPDRRRCLFIFASLLKLSTRITRQSVVVAAVEM